MLEIAADLRGWQKWESLWEPIDDDLYLKRPPNRVAQQLPHMISTMCILMEEMVCFSAKHGIGIILLGDQFTFHIFTCRVVHSLHAPL